MPMTIPASFASGFLMQFCMPTSFTLFLTLIDQNVSKKHLNGLRSFYAI